MYVLREADYAKHIKEQNADKRAKYSAFLASVPLLSEPRVPDLGIAYDMPSSL